MTEQCDHWLCAREKGHPGSHMGRPSCGHRECADDNGHIDTCWYDDHGIDV